MSTKRKYLGESTLPISETPFSEFTQIEWVLYWAEYGGFDGAHHKQWALDMVIRVANDCPITVKKAEWSDGTVNWRCSVGENDKYRKWVKDYEDGEDGPKTYIYDPGIAP